MVTVGQLFHSPIFWIGTVLTGFVLNVIAHYFVALLNSIGVKVVGAIQRPTPGRFERLRQISEWLDTHRGGASLALSRALSLEIMAVVWIVLCVGMITAGGIVINTGGSSVRAAVAMFFGVIAGLIAIANLAIAGEYEEAVSKHPNGLPDWPRG